MHRFFKFCTTFNITSPFPLSEHLLCAYAAYLADQHLAPQTIKSYLSALRSWQISLGLPDPRDNSSLPMLKRVQAGINRMRSLRGTPTKVRLPITSHLLRRIKRALDASEDLAKHVVWAIASTAFFGFFRLGELLPDSTGAFNEASCLTWGDVAVDHRNNPTMVQVHLKRSKCDQFGAGTDVVVGLTGDELCPVAAIVRYLEVRGSRRSAFFLHPSGEVVVKAWFVGRVRRILQDLGEDQSQYAGHSFRIGAATSAAMAGLEDSTIQALGRWSSAAYLLYIRTPKESLAHMSAKLAAATKPQALTGQGQSPSAQ